MLQYAYTIIYVDNIEKTVAFYKKAFGFSLKFITPEKDYAELISGETTISFASFELANQNIEGGVTRSKDNQSPNPVQLSFTSNNIEKDYKHSIQNGAIPKTDLILKPWGQTVGYVLDCNGILIEICTPILVS